MSSETAISIDGVGKRFILQSNRASSIKEAILRRKDAGVNDFWALKDVSFDIPKGSFFGIIGHNGSGKSTLLRLMAGIHRPTTGAITANGRISALLELGSGFHPDLTGRENIFLNGAMLGLGKQQMAEAIEEIVDFSGIGDFIDAPVKVYSSGMQVRLGFAVAVHVEPEILLVDEVLAVGDEEFQRKCLDHIHTLRRRGVTIVLVAHSTHLMQTMCDEVAWLDHGQLQDVGDPAEIVGAYIRQVNAKEQEHLAKQRAAEAAKRERDLAAGSSDPEPEVTDQDRQGSGEIRVTRVEYLDSDEKSTLAGSSGDPLTIRLRFEADELIQRSVFGLGIFTEHGIHVAQVNNRFTDVVQPAIEPGKGYVDVTLGHLVLLPGTYYVTTGIHSEDMMHCYDRWNEAKKFVVQPGSSRQHGALVELQADFSEATPTSS